MNRLFRLLSAILALLLLTACSKTPQAPTETVEETPKVEEVLQEETPAPQDGPDLTVFDGTYRANVPPEGDAGYVQIKAQNGFILMEHYLCMEGSVYSFWAEEFWPNNDGISAGDFASVSGMSQTFSVMTAGDGYDTMPQNRVITLTEDGVVLNYDDSDAEYYVKDTEFSYHTSKEQLRQIVGEGTERDVLCGTWSWRSSRETLCLTFLEDGSVSFLQKKVGEPAQIYEGVFAIEAGDCVSIAAEKAGDGMYPHIMNWTWHVDADNMLWLTFEDGREVIFLPTEEAVTETVSRDKALSYVEARYDLSGEYTDRYETTYDYCYRMPQFYGDDAAVMAVNGQIQERFAPIIEEELSAMAQNEFLSFAEVSFESNVHEDVLYLHIYAKTFDWEEHSAYYYDTKTGEFLTTQQVLDRLLIDQNYFLEAVREYALAAFEETFSDLSEEYKEEAGYYEMMEWTVSDAAVNFDLPIYVDAFGSVAVHAKIGSMAGSGIIWETLRPFDGAVG